MSRKIEFKLKIFCQARGYPSRLQKVTAGSRCQSGEERGMHVKMKQAELRPGPPVPHSDVYSLDVKTTGEYAVLTSSKYTHRSRGMKI